MCIDKGKGGLPFFLLPFFLLPFFFGGGFNFMESGGEWVRGLGRDMRIGFSF